MDANVTVQIKWHTMISVLAVYLSTASCGPSCANDELNEIVSPDGGHYAYVFTRNCGATTGFNAQISVQDRRGNDGRVGNVFIADGGGPKRILTPLEHVQVGWVNSVLVIRYGRDLRIFKKEERVNGIKIVYRIV